MIPAPSPAYPDTQVRVSVTIDPSDLAASKRPSSDVLLAFPPFFPSFSLRHSISIITLFCYLCQPHHIFFTSCLTSFVHSRVFATASLSCSCVSVWKDVLFLLAGHRSRIDDELNFYQDDRPPRIRRRKAERYDKAPRLAVWTASHSS